MSKFAQRMCNFVGSVNFYKAVRRPLPVCAVFDILFVGDDILGVPRANAVRPYGFNCYHKIIACRGGVSPPVANTLKNAKGYPFFKG